PDVPGGTPVELDLTALGTSVTWRVKLSGAEEGRFVRGAASTTMRRTSSDVLLGELRADPVGRLLVLPGFGWVNMGRLPPYGDDDTCDGYVRAELTIGGQRRPVSGSWIVVAPPKFAPELDHIVTLWDLMEDRLHGSGPLTGSVSYMEHIYPILKRAQSIQWVKRTAAGHHAWDLADVPSLPREQIFEALAVPSGVTPPADPTPETVPARNMPDLPSTTLTRLQYLRMQAFWSNTDFVNDWSGDPVADLVEPGASELDRAALEACNGGPFSAGVEVGYRFLLEGTFDPGDPMRVASRVAPGFFRGSLDRPWVADYLGGCANYWPIVRPTDILRGPPGSEVYEPWFTGPSTPEVIANWPSLGFIAKNETTGRYVEQGCTNTLPERFRRYVRMLRWQFRQFIRIILKQISVSR
ncbi:MAG TPA: LodA/GoxA family CTQ-dependent oxidase, partial [Polyangiaceae bacterium]